MKPILKEKPEPMRTFRLVACVGLGMLVCGAAEKQRDYQDATLMDFRTVTTGSTCHSSGDVDGKVDESGNISGTTRGNARCEDTTTRYYTISLGGHSYVLERTIPKKAAIPYAAFFIKASVLANLLPGTHISVSSDGKNFWVKVGNRESKYNAVGAK